MSIKKLDLTLPKGPIAYKIADFRDNWDFPGTLLVGPVATGKTTGMVDSIVRTAYEYPGCQMLLAGRTLTDLKRTTLEKINQRISLAIESENKNEAIYRFPQEPHPLTGVTTHSTLRCIGLDRSDIEDVMKSTEWFRVFIEEGNTVSSDAHDIVLARTRQFAFHRHLKVRHLVMDKSRLWGVNTEEAYQVLREAKEHPVHQFGLSMNDPMPGTNGMKTIMNPDGNDHLWMRFVGVPMPDGGVTDEWAKRYIGVRDYYFTKEQRDEVDTALMVGNLVVAPDGERGYVRSLIKDEVTLMNGKTFLDEQLELILQLYTIYVFGHENESKNYANYQSSLLMMNPGMRKRMFGGAPDTRGGLVFPNFDPRYYDEGGHVLHYPEKGLPTGLFGVGGVDQGGGHATAAVMLLKLKGSDIAVAFYEYVKSGVSAKDTAYELVSSVPPGITMRWAGDPAMWSRDYTDNVMTTKAQKYIDAGLNPFEPGKKGDDAFDDVVDAFEFRDGFLGRPKEARLYVFDNCQQLIMMLQTLRWKDVRHGRHKWVVDLGDALKLGVSALSMNNMRGNAPMPVPRPIYSNRFIK